MTWDRSTIFMLAPDEEGKCAAGRRRAFKVSTHGGQTLRLPQCPDRNYSSDAVASDAGDIECRKTLPRRHHRAVDVDPAAGIVEDDDREALAVRVFRGI